ncbi:hypothetical protein [Halorussus pelagicus]|uniref:hypothetical protein n=1 Tax=Halorussus pelagicus TaxID=2505977 RepID=UPI000FFC54C7|nr:hypothetical protein [Halorussus pelagicus]
MAPWILRTALAILGTVIALSFAAANHLIVVGVILATIISTLYDYKDDIKKNLQLSRKPLLIVIGGAVVFHIIASYFDHSNYSAPILILAILVGAIIYYQNSKTAKLTEM